MKWHLCLVSLCCILGLLTGCGVRLPEVSSILQPSAAPEAEEPPEEFQAPLFRDAEPAVLWGRDQLEEHAQSTYDKMSEAIACYRETPLEIDADAAEIELVLEALRIDHPEYFWFDGEASFVSTELAGITISTTCTLSYTMDAGQIQQAGQQVQQYTAACLSSPELAAAQTDYEKILGVYRYLIEHTDYVAVEEDQSILSVMADNRGTCAGYARSFQYLMSQLGIPCTMALGTGASGESHGWNMVQCGGQWYQMDVTWGDPVTPEGTPGNSLLYTYCMVTDAEIYRDHTLDCHLPMPVCTATAYNYFIHEGLQFDVWDPEAYAAALSAAAEREESWLSVRFSTEDGYQAALEELLGQGRIMDMLADCVDTSGRQYVTYTQNDLFYEISVLLA